MREVANKQQKQKRQMRVDGLLILSWEEKREREEQKGDSLLLCL